MELQNSEQGHIIEVHGNVPAEDKSLHGIKICGEAPCGFADVKTSSKDAEERNFLIAVVLYVILMSVEVVGGIKANSLAILTDAAHLLLDVAAFAISFFSIRALRWEATPRQSYGFFRIEILGALVSIQMIWLLAGILVYEAIARLICDNGEVKGFLMFAVSAFDLVVNIAMALLLGHGHGHNHGHGGRDHGHGKHHHGHGDHGDTREPLLKPYCESDLDYLHVLGDSDIIHSIGVLIGGAIIWYNPKWKIVDLICTLISSAVVLGTTIRMLRNIMEVLMESTPREIDAKKLEKGLCEMDEVVAIHELHIWAITLGKVLLACHVIVKPDADADMVLDKVIDYIRREYNISHVTIQIERE